jgi:hypothetical protein
LKYCSKKRRATSVAGFAMRAAAAHVSRHGSRVASAPQLAMNADHASATASSRQPGSSPKAAGLNTTPGALGALAGALLGSALDGAFADGVAGVGAAGAGACARGVAGGVALTGGCGAGAETGGVVHAAASGNSAIKAKRAIREWILKSGSLIMAASIPSDFL